MEKIVYMGCNFTIFFSNIINFVNNDELVHNLHEEDLLSVQEHSYENNK